MLGKMMDSPIAWAVLALVTVVSFVYAIVCQNKNKEKKEISYCLKSKTLIKNKKLKYEKLAILYEGRQIDCLSVSRLTIWNSGNRTLNSSDLVETKELTVSISGDSEILDVEDLICSEETNKFLLVPVDEHNIKISFDYADKNDGIVIQLIHTGSCDDITVSCKIKGGKPIKNAAKNTFPKNVVRVIRSNTFEKISIITTGVMVLFFFAISIGFFISIFNPELQSILLSTESYIDARKLAVQLTISYTFVSVAFGIIYFVSMKKYLNVGIPKKLKTYTDF